MIGIAFRGDDVFKKYLDSLRGRVENMSGIMKAIGDKVTSQTKRRFNDSRNIDPDGKPWKKPQKDNPKRVKTLVVTGHLRDSIRPRASKNKVVIGTNKVYAATHQFGRANIPARPYLGLSVENAEELKIIIEDYLMR